MTTLLIGFDSAWTAENSGALVGVMRRDDDRYIELGPPIIANFAEAERIVDRWKLQLSPSATVQLLDQPTIVNNAEGQRPVENIVGSAISRRYPTQSVPDPSAPTQTDSKYIAFHEGGLVRLDRMGSGVQLKEKCFSGVTIVGFSCRRGSSSSPCERGDEDGRARFTADHVGPHHHFKILVFPAVRQSRRKLHKMLRRLHELTRGFGP